MFVDEMKLIYPDGYETDVMFMKAEHPIGNIFLFHGMLEHYRRYIEFAHFLTENGFNVYACDLRGAGPASHEQDYYGHLEPEEGFQQMVEDAQYFINQFQDELPTFVLGHSFGSLLARRLGQVMGQVLAGVIAVSPPPHSGVAGLLGHSAISTALKRKGSTHRSKLFERLLFGRYNMKFLPARTSSDWISSSPEEVDAYLTDQHCGGLPTLGYLYEVTKASLDVTTSARIHEHPREVPILFVVGAEDPVIFDGERLKGIIKKYQAADVEICVSSYDGARHEVLREEQREQVWADISLWLEQTSNQ